MKQNQNQEKAAINSLTQISNQDNNYAWTNKQTRYDNFTDFSKRKRTIEHINKSVKLPIIIKRRPMEDVSQLAQNRYKSNQKQKPNSVRTFFKPVDVYPSMVKLEHPNNELLNNEDGQNKRTNQLQIVKSWLTRKRLQCKSLNNIINKFRDDSGRYKSSQQILPFTIKSLI